MSHAVLVRDPWFGLFQTISFGGTWPSFLVGPLSERPVSQEVIRNLGCQVEANGVREKNCRHEYVDGFVTGNPGPATRNVLPVQGGSFRITQSYSNGQVIYQYDVTCTGNWSETSGVGLYHCKCVYNYWLRGVLQPGYPKTGYMDVSYKVSVDAIAGTRTFGSWTKKSIWGDTPANAYTTPASNPYGGGGDGLGGRIQSIRGWMTVAFNAFPPLPAQRTLRDEAIWKAIEDTEVACINPLQDFNDLAQPLGLVTQLAQYFKKPGNALEAVKKLANLHLFWKYVIKTNLLTGHEVGILQRYLSGGARAAIDRVCNADLIGRGRAEKTYDTDYGSRTVCWTAKVCYGAGLSPFASLAKLRRIGVYPGAGDVWDMVPYSFVVDWILPIQTCLDRADAMVDTLHLPLRYLLLSRKVTDHVDHSFSEGTHSFTANVRRVNYRRTVYYSLPPDFGMGDVSFSNPLKHGLTGLALIIQRR